MSAATLMSTGLFNDASTSTIREIAAESVLFRLPKGVIFFEAGDIPKFVYIIVQGTVEIGLINGSREHTARIVDAPHIALGDAAIVNCASSLNYKCLTDCRALGVAADRFRNAIQTDPGLCQDMLAVSANKAHYYMRQIASLKSRTAIERLAAWIQIQCQINSDKSQYDIPYSKKTIANLMGMSPASLSRAISELEERGGVSVDRNRIIVSNLTKLEGVASLSPLLDEIPKGRTTATE